MAANRVPEDDGPIQLRGGDDLAAGGNRSAGQARVVAKAHRAQAGQGARRQWIAESIDARPRGRLRDDRRGREIWRVVANCVGKEEAARASTQTVSSTTTAPFSFREAGGGPAAARARTLSFTMFVVAPAAWANAARTVVWARSEVTAAL